MNTAEWQSKKIGQLGRVVTGKTPPTKQPELYGDVYPFITPTDISENLYSVETARFLSQEGYEFQSNLLIPPKSVCYTCIASIGKICLTAKPSFTNQQINTIIVNHDEYDYRFVYYLLIYETERIKKYAGGAAAPIINKSAFSDIDVTVPELPTQRRIADILSAYDDLIENNTRRIRILEGMAQAIYQEWFGTVDKESLPKGWEIGKLEDALVLQRGFDLPIQDRKDGDVPIYAATGITGFHNEAKIKAPGIVTGRSGSLGTVIYIDKDFWALNTTLWVKEFRRVTPLFAYYLLSDLKLEQFNSGAAVPTLNRNDIHGMPVLIPSSDILQKFDEVVLPMYSLASTLRTKNSNLRQTRDLLLPRLVSGEIEVSELDDN